MPRRPHVLAALLLAVAILATSSPASAGWGSTGAGPARAQAVVVPAGATPSATKAFPASNGYSPEYTVTWPTARLASGEGVVGYQIRRTINPRNAARYTEPVSGGSCAGVTVNGLSNVYVPANPNAPTQSCTDTNAYITGEVTFTVTPVMGRWVGPTSPESPVYS